MFEKVPAGCDAIFMKVNIQAQIYDNSFLELQLRKMLSNTITFFCLPKFRIE